jgi:hypothetical protein
VTGYIIVVVILLVPIVIVVAGSGGLSGIMDLGKRHRGPWSGGR